MAKAYYMEFISVPGAYKNSTMEARAVGGAFAYCVYDTLLEYGLQPDSQIQGPKEYNEILTGRNRLKAFIVYIKHSGDSKGLITDMDEAVDISLTEDNKLLVDFKFDPFFPENSNDELIADIKEKAVKKRLIDQDAQIFITDSSYVERHSGGGCYIATAVYGSYDSPQVWTLRRYRDAILAKCWYGRAFIRFYYALSPTLVRWFGQTEWFKRLWRGPLDAMVQKLQKKGF